MTEDPPGLEAGDATLGSAWTSPAPSEAGGEPLQRRHSGPDDLIGWLPETRLLAPGTVAPATAAVLMSARRLRETVDRAVLAVTDSRLPTSGDVRMLNRSAAAAPRPALQLGITEDRLHHGPRCGNRTEVRLHQARTRQSGRITES
ncbi:ABATE domain-containing protein [Streptomyces sp. CA-210063]|uniref:ABATE domain-containing protein n=1 Tax=Streptomyces sp. CA-210063 TaxID=2801029 RepID=UPI00214B1164|nr:ABATE domain-containing protein [Streptomyces sp. CA-210063]UUU36296.1 ABATE domain-containing protein [Streptomyces sp. CA-210063]